MSTDPADADRSRGGRPSLSTHLSLRSLLLGLLLVALLPLTACSEDLPPPTYAPEASVAVAEQMQRTLNRRARALRARDEAGFRRTLRRGDPALLREQETYFDNLSQLPVGVLRLRLLRETVTPVDGSEAYWAEVQVILRLDGYDARPVRTRDRFRFTPTADGRRMLVASTTDARWETDHPGNAQPWDLGPIRVSQTGGVLGIFDDSTIGSASRVLDAAGNGRYDVRVHVPHEPSVSGGIVVYALRDRDFLRGLAGLTVGDPERADGLTIAIPVDAYDRRLGVASYRVYLNPRVLDQEQDVLARLVRHELTHATLGARGRGAPLWLTEGIAEYVSVRPMPVERRRLPASALSVGRDAADLPGEAEFGGGDAEAWYAISWWVCEYIASTYGERVLWFLLDRLAAGEDQAAVVPELLGVTTAQLTQRAVALMTTTYRR